MTHHRSDSNGMMNHTFVRDTGMYPGNNSYPSNDYSNITHSTVSPKPKHQRQRRRSSTHSINSIAQMTMDAMSCGMHTEATMTVSTSTSPSTATSGTTSPTPPTTTTKMTLQDVPEDVVVIDRSNHYTSQQQQHRSTSSSSLQRSVPPPINQRTESISLMSLGNPSNHQQHPHQASLAASSLSFRFGKNNSSSHHTQSNNSSLGSNRMMFTLNESYTSFAQPPPPPFYQSQHLLDEENPSSHLTGTKIKNRRPSIFTSYSGKNYVIDDTTNGEPVPMMVQQQSMLSQQQLHSQSQQHLASHSAHYNRIETNSLACPTDDSTIDQVPSLRGANSSPHRHPQQSQNVIRSIGYHGGRDNSNADSHMINVPRRNFSSESDDSRNADLSLHYKHQQHQRMNHTGGEGNHQAVQPPPMHQSHHHSQQHQVERIKVLLSVENLDRIPPPLPHLPLCPGLDMNTRKQQHYVACVSIQSKRCLNSNNNDRLHSLTTNGIPVGISVSTTNLSSGFETKRHHCYVMDCPRCYHKMIVSKYCTIIQCPECSTSHPAQESKEKAPLNV